MLGVHVRELQVKALSGQSVYNCSGCCSELYADLCHTFLISFPKTHSLSSLAIERKMEFSREHKLWQKQDWLLPRTCGGKSIFTPMHTWSTAAESNMPTALSQKLQKYEQCRPLKESFHRVNTSKTVHYKLCKGKISGRYVLLNCNKL